MSTAKRDIEEQLAATDEQGEPTNEVDIDAEVGPHWESKYPRLFPYPSIIGKATLDMWYYILETKTGQQFVFGGAVVLNDDMIHLEPVDESYAGHGAAARALDLCFDAPGTRPQSNAYGINERGIDIRIDSIAWVADGVS